MGKRSDRRTFRRRRRWAGLFLLVSFALVVFGARLFWEVSSADLQAAASGGVEKVGVEQVKAVLAGAPEAAGDQKKEEAAGDQKKEEVALLAAEEEDNKTQPEKQEVDKEAAQRADEKAAAEEQAAGQSEQADQQKDEIPTPPTNDLWFSIPALGLYDNYITSTNDFSAMDYGAIKLANSGFPWQEGANTYIAAHRLGWPGTGSHRQFYNLPLLSMGDVIYLGDVNGTTYTYKVSGFKEITPDERWITAPQPGRDMISLQTCIEDYGDYWTMGPNWNVRYVVQADRVSVTPAR